MSEEKKEDPRLTALKQLAWIHQRLLTTPHYLEEMSIADASVKMIADMARKIDQELKAEEEAKDVEETKAE